jgi:hypothetical protein
MEQKLPTLYTLLETVSKQKKKQDKINMLKMHNNKPAVSAILDLVFNPKHQFTLPEGDPPYTPAEDMIDNTGALYREFRKFEYFMDSPTNNLHQIKRETLFIQLLESLHPEDAKLVVAVKDKKLPFKGITLSVVQETWPGMIK